MTTRVGFVDKRIRDNVDDPMIPTTNKNKRRKMISAEVKTSTTSATESKASKVDPTELASAFALASLASFSLHSTSSKTPSTTSNTQSKQQGRKDAVQKVVSFEEARSPKPEGPRPMSPEQRNTCSTEERSAAPKGEAPSIPSTPNDSDISMSRRVHYAPSGNKHFMLSPSTPHSVRSPLPPYNPTRRLIVPPRQMGHRPPVHMARGPPPPYMGPMNTSFARFPSPRLAHMHPQHMFHPHPHHHPHHSPSHHHRPHHLHPHPHHHPHHSPIHHHRPHHLHPQSPLAQSPRGWYAAPAGPAVAHNMHHPPPPPQSLMQPPLQHPEKPWICDHCNVAAFATYEEACAHETTCKHRFSSAQQQRMRSNSVDDERMDVESSSSSSSSIVQRKTLPSAAAATAASPKFFEGSRSLSMKEDKEWLSEINCFIRDHCIEVFSASSEDVARTSKRAGRLIEGQVGIRCKFCKDCPARDKSVGAVSFPSSVTGIYDAVKRWQRVHLEVCEFVPENVRTKLAALANTNVWFPTTRQYWADSAMGLGLVDTPDGIRFSKDPSGDANKDIKMALAASRSSIKQEVPQTKAPEEEACTVASKGASTAASEDDKCIVKAMDKGTVPPYVFFLMSQVEPCQFTEADRFVARSKGPVGYPGFRCRHCNGHAGLGKYFPVSAKSLATNSTSQNIHAHLLKCRKCPDHVKKQLVELKIQKSRSARMEPGWRKVFFDMVWGRLHGRNPRDESTTTNTSVKKEDT